MQKENTQRLLLVKRCTGRLGLRCGKCSMGCLVLSCKVVLSQQLFEYLCSQPSKCDSWGVCLSWCHLSFIRVVSWLLLWAILSDHCIPSAMNIVLPDPEIWPHGDFWTESKNAGKVPGAQTSLGVRHSLCRSLSLQALTDSPHFSWMLPSGTGGLACWCFWQLSVKEMSWVFLSNLIGFFFSAVRFLCRDWYLCLDASRKWMQSPDV